MTLVIDKFPDVFQPVLFFRTKLINHPLRICQHSPQSCIVNSIQYRLKKLDDGLIFGLALEIESFRIAAKNNSLLLIAFRFLARKLKKLYHFCRPRRAVELIKYGGCLRKSALRKRFSGLQQNSLFRIFFCTPCNSALNPGL